MDALAQAMMKGAVKCEEHCELQNSVNQQSLECEPHPWEIPEWLPFSAFPAHCQQPASHWLIVVVRVRVCLSRSHPR